MVVRQAAVSECGPLQGKNGEQRLSTAAPCLTYGEKEGPLRSPVLARAGPETDLLELRDLGRNLIPVPRTYYRHTVTLLPAHCYLITSSSSTAEVPRQLTASCGAEASTLRVLVASAFPAASYRETSDTAGEGALWCGAESHCSHNARAPPLLCRGSSLTRPLELTRFRGHCRSHESAVGVVHGQAQAAGVHGGVQG